MLFSVASHSLDNMGKEGKFLKTGVALVEALQYNLVLSTELTMCINRTDA